MQYGWILILNGAPRSGKSSIASMVQDTFDGVWINLGVDAYMRMIPDRYQPGIGLRPGGERPDLEPLVARMYGALFESMAAHSRAGLNIVADLGIHDGYSQPLQILSRCASILADLPTLFVGIVCPVEIIMDRRKATWNQAYESNGPIPAPVARWQAAVHDPGIYDLRLDTGLESAQVCAERIRQRLDTGERGIALRKIARSSQILDE